MFEHFEALLQLVRGMTASVRGLAEEGIVRRQLQLPLRPAEAQLSLMGWYENGCA